MVCIIEKIGRFRVRGFLSSELSGKSVHLFTCLWHIRLKVKLRERLFFRSKRDDEILGYLRSGVSSQGENIKMEKNYIIWQD